MIDHLLKRADQLPKGKKDEKVPSLSPPIQDFLHWITKDSSLIRVLSKILTEPSDENDYYFPQLYSVMRLSKGTNSVNVSKLLNEHLDKAGEDPDYIQFVLAQPGLALGVPERAYLPLNNDNDRSVSLITVLKVLDPSHGNLWDAVGVQIQKEFPDRHEFLQTVVDELHTREANPDLLGSLLKGLTEEQSVDMCRLLGFGRDCPAGEIDLTSCRTVGELRLHLMRMYLVADGWVTSSKASIETGNVLSAVCGKIGKKTSFPCEAAEFIAPEEATAFYVDLAKTVSTNSRSKINPPGKCPMGASQERPSQGFGVPVSGY